MASTVHSAPLTMPGTGLGPPKTRVMVPVSSSSRQMKAAVPRQTTFLAVHDAPGHHQATTGRAVGDPAGDGAPTPAVAGGGFPPGHGSLARATFSCRTSM